MYYLSSFSDDQDIHSLKEFNVPPVRDDILHKQEDDSDYENNYDIS